MNIEIIIGAAIVVLLIAMYVKHRSKPVDMNHQAPNVHNVQMEGRVGPATAADKKAAEPAPKAVKAAKAPAKKATKKTATKKAAKADLDSMSKNDLLAHAKANGVKANASMNKAAILEAIKNG
jgi:hypothetical protein